MKNTIYILLFTGMFWQCNDSQNTDFKTINPELNKQIPKVVFLTTGFSNENKHLPEGISVAIQSFNKRGVLVQLEPRDILLDYEKLSKFNIIIASTSEKYHDNDRLYSLTYMSDLELENIEKFVGNGGILISGDNFGRNYSDGTDRVSVFNVLNEENWALAKCFGVSMTEINMVKYSIVSSKNNELQLVNKIKDTNDFWTLAVDSIVSNKIKNLAFWENGKEKIPAIFQNKYKKGLTFQLAYSDFLHPISQDGKGSVSQIDNFYDYVLKEFYKENQEYFGTEIQLNSWKNGHEYAFCVSFNSSRKLENYEKIVDYLKSKNIKPTIFVDGFLNDTIKEYLIESNIETQSSGFNYMDFSETKYSVSNDDILRNQNKWETKFKGFRFPFYKQGYWGLLALDEHNYLFESSISANNIEKIDGSVFPYNIVISNDNYYKSTSLLELSPSNKNHYHYLKTVLDKEEINENDLTKQVELYSDFLQTYWDLGVKKHNGLFVYLGHPDLVGHNKITLSVLEKLIDSVQNENTWIASMEEIADFRNKLSQFSYFVSKNKNKTTISVKGKKGITCEKTAINISFKPKRVKVKNGEVIVLENSKGYSIVFDSFDEQIIEFQD